jgi:hypothetical protein
MLCPYCSEYIRDDALRCKICHGDVVLYRFLREKAEAELGLNRPSRPAATAALPDDALVVASAEAKQSELPDAPEAARSSRFRGHAMQTSAVCVLALILAYFIVGILLRADGLPLRAISILVPLHLGIWLSLRERPTHRGMLIASLAVPTLAMVGGRAVAAMWAGEPLIARDHTWDYLLSYWASMGFSFLTGAYIGELTYRYARSRVPAAASASDPVARRREFIARAKQLGPILGPIATAIASFATGVGDYLGK